MSPSPLSTELQYLFASVILGFVYIFCASAGSTKQRGSKWNLSARDQPPPPLTGAAARLDRASTNFKETFPLFAAAVLMVQVTNHLGPFSLYGAAAYFWARVAYIPLYALGVPYVRTLIWLVSLAGIAGVLMSLVTG